VSVALRRVSCGDVDGAPSWCVASLPRLAEPDDDIAGRVDWNAATSTVSLSLDDDDHVYGLGAGAVGAPLRNGQLLRLMNRDTIFYGIEGATYASFPLVWLRTSTGDTMAFVVLTARPLDVDVALDAVRFRDVVGGLAGVDVVVADGRPADIAADLGALLGTTPVPPAWALGFHQSRWSYRTAEDVVGVAEAARRYDVPLDVVHLDIHMMDDYRVFTWHPRRFPEPGAMHRRLAELGVRTMAIVDPGVSTAPRTPVRDALVAVDGLLERRDGSAYEGKVWPGATVFPDFGKPGVVDVWARAHRALTDVGVAGFWNDMNDPVFHVGVVYDPLREDVVHREGEGRVPHHERRNLYANEMAAATRQGLDDGRPDERHFVVSRSGFLGIQRHAALWTGDNFSSWEQLEEGLHMVVHLGLSGVPLSGADIGGFGGRRGKYGIAKWKPSAELMVRWLELGALLPFCRVHSVLYGPAQEPWSFSATTTTLARRILRRRYRLLALWSSLAREAHETGMPLVRPLWFHDDVPRRHGDLAARQFLLGADVLAAPVLRDGVRRREVFLPEGRWLDTRDGVVRVAPTGGLVTDVDAPLGAPPLFVRAGAVIPWLSPGRNADDTLRGPLTLELVAPSSLAAQTRVVLDDGRSRAGHADIFVRPAHDEARGLITIDLDVVERGFVPVQRTMILRLPPGFSSVINGEGATYAAHTRLLETHGDDGRGGEVSEVEVPLHATRLVAR
jgi:alpha-glucosidase